MIVKYNLQQINDVATQLIPFLQKHKVLALYGPMGSGKTTLTAAICHQLNSADNIDSPTFSIINQYKIEQGFLYHMDLYRLKNEDEAISAGVEDALYSNNLCIVEWPEIATNILPENTCNVYIKIINEQERALQVNNF